MTAQMTLDAENTVVLQEQVESFSDSVIANWSLSTERQLRAIANLPFGWDSNGAAPPNPAIVYGAYTLLEALRRSITWLPKPHINPTRNGTVQFEWEIEAQYLEIEMTNAREAHYYFEDQDRHEEHEGTLRVGQSINELIHYLGRLRA